MSQLQIKAPVTVGLVFRTAAGQVMPASQIVSVSANALPAGVVEVAVSDDRTSVTIAPLPPVTGVVVVQVDASAEDGTLLDAGQLQVHSMGPDVPFNPGVQIVV